MRHSRRRRKVIPNFATLPIFGIIRGMETVRSKVYVGGYRWMVGSVVCRVLMAAEFMFGLCEAGTLRV